MDDVVLLASSGGGLQVTLERFLAECEAAGMRIVRKGTLWVRDELLLTRFAVGLFTSDGEREMDRRSVAASADSTLDASHCTV